MVTVTVVKIFFLFGVLKNYFPPLVVLVDIRKRTIITATSD